jgi:ureidoglycolate lyase
MVEVSAQPLDATAFAPFGQVIAVRGASAAANQGRAQRFDAGIAFSSADARAHRLCTAVYRIRQSVLPFDLTVVERHPLSQQLFFPNSGARFLACACGVLPDGEPDLSSLRAFMGEHAQGIVWHQGVWHSPFVALDADGDFLMQQWQCDGPLDCEERTLAAPMRIVGGP